MYEHIEAPICFDPCQRHSIAEAGLREEFLMSNEELVGRMAALEVIAMTALGLHLANARHDPDYPKSGQLLASIREAL